MTIEQQAELCRRYSRKYRDGDDIAQQAVLALIQGKGQTTSNPARRCYLAVRRAATAMARRMRPELLGNGCYDVAGRADDPADVVAALTDVRHVQGKVYPEAECAIVYRAGEQVRLDLREAI